MKKSTGIVVCLLGIAGIYWFVQAGSLEPTALPAPTMTELDHVRGIPIYQSDFEPAGYLIDSPGSYYLTNNITVAGNGIVIAGVNANNITIDLMGHNLSGGSGRGVNADHGTKNLAVINGTVSGWGVEGINLGNATDCLVQNVRATDNQGTGIWVGMRGRVIDSMSMSNGYFGIRAETDSMIVRSVAYDNAEDGISTAGNCSISYCKVIANGDPGGPPDDDGIVAGSSSVIEHCTSHGNWGDGIEVHSDSVLFRNECDHQDDSNGACINVTGANNRIESNHMVRNGFAIKVDGDGGNLIIGNSAGKEGAYQPAPGDLVGIVVTDSAGLNAAENCFANVKY